MDVSLAKDLLLSMEHLDLIDPTPDNVKIFNMAHIDALADTIKDEGFTGAIEMVALPNG